MLQKPELNTNQENNMERLQGKNGEMKGYREHQREMSIKQQVRQGCSSSLLIFNAYIQRGSYDVGEETDNRTGIKVRGDKIDMIRFVGNKGYWK